MNDPADDLAQLTKNPTPTLADEVKTFEDQQQMQSGKFKEQLEALGNLNREQPNVAEQKIQDVQEVATNPEIDPTHEIAGYVEKIEHEAELHQPVTDDYTNQVLLKSSANLNPVVTLPLTEEQVKQGMHRQVWEAVRWLATWCFRQAKLLHGKVKYRS